MEQTIESGRVFSTYSFMQRHAENVTPTLSSAHRGDGSMMIGLNPCPLAFGS